MVNRSKSFIRNICIALIGCLLSGCALGRKSVCPEQPEPQELYVKQVTTRDDVLDELGPPLKMTVLAEGYAFMYESLQTQELQLGFSIPVPVLKWFKIVLADADYKHHVQVYQFNKQHKLVAWDSDLTSFDLGDSFAVQPVFSVEMLFDMSGVEAEVIDATAWPAYGLLPLPQALNRGNAINVGIAGIEQRGCATRVGQRSCEHHK